MIHLHYLILIIIAFLLGLYAELVYDFIDSTLSKIDKAYWEFINKKFYPTALGQKYVIRKYKKLILENRFDYKTVNTFFDKGHFNDKPILKAWLENELKDFHDVVKK